MKNYGLSGNIAKAFITSKLTPIIVAVALLLGFMAVLFMPREEEPQIVVPMIDVFVQYPGATPEEVENRVTRPMEQLLWEVPGVEYVYSTIQAGQNLTIVRFKVGEKTEDSLVNLYNKLMSNYDRIPAGVSQPLVKARSIDDVPVLSLTFWSKDPHYSGYELRRVAAEVADVLKKDERVAEINLTGGQKRQLLVQLDPTKLQAYGLTIEKVQQVLQQSNQRLSAGSMTNQNQNMLIEAGNWLSSPEDFNQLVVGVSQNRPVYLKDVAQIKDQAEEPAQYVFMGFGPAGSSDDVSQHEAVTLSLAKKKGTNATDISEEALQKFEQIKGYTLPQAVEVNVTRNYGETAKEKSDELLNHMLIATISVVILMAFALGWQEALVVAVAVPVTLALTLALTYAYGYTLNRVTLFAFIFSIGILVDDAIVVVENIHRHFKLSGVSLQTAIEAAGEVGNPTILATIAVIAALMPMAFVSGLMGPYMRPIPVGASGAMFFSLLVAFIVTPWLSYKVLKSVKKDKESSQNSKILMKYERFLEAYLGSGRKRAVLLSSIVALLLVVILLVPLRAVTVKMMPFDNKSELQVILDMPENAALEQTAALSQEIGQYLQTVPEVKDFQSYIGTASPYNFNGLVRHYYLRSGPAVGDIQVNFVSRHDRADQSNDLAKKIRDPIQNIGQKYGARIKIAEVPPGPPVQSTLVAEVYGPDPLRRQTIAGELKNIFATTPGVVDVDWLVEADQPKLRLKVDQAKAALYGVAPSQAAQTLQTALSGQSAGQIHFPADKEPVPILLKFSLADRNNLNQLQKVPVLTNKGTFVPLAELVKVEPQVEAKTLYHKNLKPVTYVTAEVAGAGEAPLYPILDMKDRINAMKLPEGYDFKQYNAISPPEENRYAMKWDGEWHITIEVFRDMGLAFAVVLVLIYILLVTWFKSFTTPLIIMAPIPLTLVGILPGHYIFHAFFSATSMIGFIALAGIIVRNSILLVDFIESQRKEGYSVKEAVITAASVRFRPIVLTALAVVVGSFVMFFDPIFQGLAIAMMFGAVAATGLTLVVVPLLYYQWYHE